MGTTRYQLPFFSFETVRLSVSFLTLSLTAVTKFLHSISPCNTLKNQEKPSSWPKTGNCWHNRFSSVESRVPAKMTTSCLSSLIERHHSLLQDLSSPQSYVLNSDMLCTASKLGFLHLLKFASEKLIRFTLPTSIKEDCKIKLNSLNTLAAIWNTDDGLMVQALENGNSVEPIKIFQVEQNDSIVFVEWHPVSLYSDHLLILTKLGNLYLYRVTGSNPVLDLELSVRSKDRIQYNCVDATLLDSTEGWNWSTLLILLENGDVIQLCPIIPLPAKVDTSYEIDNSMKSGDSLIITKNPFKMLPFPSRPFLLQPEPIEINADFTVIENFCLNGLLFVLIGWGNYRIDLFLLSTKPEPRFEYGGDDLVMCLLESIEFPKGAPTSKMAIKRFLDDSFLVTLQGLKQSYKLTFPWLSSFGDSQSVKSEITPLLKSPADHIDVSIVMDSASNSTLFIFPSALPTFKPILINETCEVKSDRKPFQYSFYKSLAERQLEKCKVLKLTGTSNEPTVSIPVGFMADSLSKCKLPYDMTEDNFEALLQVVDDIRCKAFTKLTGAVQDLQSRLDYIESTKAKHNELIDQIQDRLGIIQEQLKFADRLENAKQKGKTLRKRLFEVLEKFDAIQKSYQRNDSVISPELEARLAERIVHIQDKLSQATFGADSLCTSCESERNVAVPSAKVVEEVSLALSMLKTR